jgi:signal peptidase II
MQEKPSTLYFVLFASLVVGLDQLSKLMVLQSIPRGEILPVIPGFFNLTLTFNYGAAFGLWSWLPEGVRQLTLAGTIILALVVVFFFLCHPAYQTRPARAALAAILGGAIGNVLDRVNHGAVVDFLDIFVGKNHWPAFNLADSAICMGVGILLLFPGRKMNGVEQVGESA